MSMEMDSEESTTSGVVRSEQKRAGVSRNRDVGSPTDGRCISVVGASPHSEDFTPNTHNTVTITSLDERSDQSESTNAAKCSGSGCEDSQILDEVMDVVEEKEDESEDDLQLSFTDMEYQQAQEDSDDSREDSVDDIRDVAGADEKQDEGSVEGSGNTRRNTGADSSQEEVLKPYYQDYTVPPNDERSWAAMTEEDKELDLKEGSLPLDAQEDQERMEDLVVREGREENPEMMHEEETELELAERVREAEVRLKGVENERFYKPCTDKFPKHATLRAVAYVDQRRIGEFVQHREEQLQAHDYHIHEENNPEGEQVFSVNPPSSRSIVCSVVDIRGAGSAVLTPVHLEVVAGKRFDLQFLILTRGTYDVYSKKFFEIRDLQLGDLVYVDIIVPFHEDVRKPMVTSVEDIDNKSKHYFWKVKIATLLPRIILKGKFARRFKTSGPFKFTYLCEEVDLPAVIERSMKKDTQVKFQDWMRVDVMIPMILPGINVRDFSPDPEDEKEARNLFNSHYPIWNIPPTILAMEPLNEREQGKFDLGVNQFSPERTATQGEFFWLSHFVKVGVWCQAAIANTRFDPRHYPAKVVESDDTVYGDTLKFKLEYPKHLPVKVKNWNRNTPVSVRVDGEYISGIVLSALDYKDEGFFVVIKITRDLKYALEAYVDGQGIITHVRQEVDDMIRTQIGKLRPPEYGINQPAMDAVVACHGGKRVKESPFAQTKRSFQFGKFTSTPDQGLVYSMLKDAGIQAFLLDCCFGAGKTSTLVASMCKLIESSTNDQVQWHIITGQSNGAVTQAVKSWVKIDHEKVMKVVRIITPANRARIDTSCQTPFDLPVMLWEVLKDAFKRYNFRGKKQNEVSINVTRHLYNKRKIGSTREINNKVLKEELVMVDEASILPGLLF
ncbi:hypothetical protein CAEBREN_01743 [Caenorhabditis brenneri]|uniref:Uncharacterized protein n=1 Tax=Caenorhabditis brenneri TaxID=135651 RepID=G0NWG9_CAEBE|nr:hypothetical protein CAEBREN_01743 [Caenorhabditis brenneri]